MRHNFHIVLLQPEIPGNTGNVGRTCVGFDIPLHLIGPLGFKLDDKEIRRAGLDYWPKLEIHQYKDWDEFKKSVGEERPFGAFFPPRESGRFARPNSKRKRF